MMRKTRVRALTLMLVVSLLLTLSAGCGVFRIRFGPAGTTGASAGTTRATTAVKPSGTTKAPATSPATTAATKGTTAATTTAALPTQAGLFGNTNGNLANGGFAAYDAMTASHLIGISGALLRYHPDTGKTETVLAVTGRPTHINVSTAYYYYISSADGAFYRVGRDGAGLRKMADGPCAYAGRVNHYVQVLQGGQLVLLYDGKDDAAAGTYSGDGVTEPSLGSNRVFYLAGTGEYRVSANNGQGRTTVYGGQAFQSAHHLFQTMDDSFAYVDRQGTGETIYTFPSLGEPAALAGVGTLTAIPSLNMDHMKRFHFVGVVDGAARLYRMDTTVGAVPVELAALEGSSPRVNLANGTVYVQDPATGTVTRIRPDTGVKEAVKP